jgi:hypothetical protein
MNISEISEATGTDLTELSNVMLSYVLDNCLCANFDREELTKAVLGLLTELQPKTALEGLLVAQMVSASLNSMRLTSLALGGDKSEPCSTTMNLAIKLQKLFLDQVNALEKLRGNKGHQKMTVKYVHVHEGGQAVIGSIENKNLNTGGDKES